jgi:hypothetical protein
MRIKLSSNSKHPFLQQTPGGKGAWKGDTYVLNEPMEECDAWVVYENLYGQESTICSPDNLLLITGEPSEVRKYAPDWTKQFAMVRSVQVGIRHANLQIGQTALPWHLGKSYDELAASDFPEKADNISIICSNKVMTRSHRRRLAFVEQLMRLNPMPRFGRGFHDLATKWEGLAPFRYSLAIENSQHDHYWTEKIADCFLAGTVPIYWGAPNIREYFPDEAMIILDTLDPAQAARIIEEEATEESYRRRLPALREAKRRVLEEYNLFEVVHQMVRLPQANVQKAKVTVVPEARPLASKLFLRIKRLFALISHLCRS